jgi:hypothetical protein
MIRRIHSDLPESAIEDAIGKLTRYDFARSMLQHNQG